MIYALLRRNLTCCFSKNSSLPGKSQDSSLISKLYFSTFREGKSSNPKLYEFLLNKHSFSPAVASYVASFLTNLKSPEKCDLVLSFLKELGFSKSQLERTLKGRPCLLSASLERTIKPKIKIFQDMGFTAADIADIISKDAMILHVSAKNRIIPALSLLTGMMGSSINVAKALRKCGRLLRTDLKKNMVPNVKFLKSCDIPHEQIAMNCCKYPRFFLYKPEIMRNFVDRVDLMGVDRSSKRFVCVLAAVGSMTNEKWELKLQDFQNILRFSEDDILRVLRQSPKVLRVSKDKMKRLNEVLLATGEYETSCIVKFPLSLTYSIEKRFKPRVEVLQTLESRQLIKGWPSLEKLCKMSDHMFFDEFVSPYTKEVGHIYLAHRALNEKRGDTDSADSD